MKKVNLKNKIKNFVKENCLNDFSYFFFRNKKINGYFEIINLSNSDLIYMLRTKGNTAACWDINCVTKDLSFLLDFVPNKTSVEIEFERIFERMF